MKNISVVIVVIFVSGCLANMCLAQAAFDFNDNDLSSWNGNTSHFIINTSHQLQLNNNVAASSFLATSFAPAQADLEWNVYVRQAFAGSGNNYGRIYLLSSQSNLTQPTEGYFLQLGEAGSNDAVELFRQSGSAMVSVCRAAAATIAAAFTIRIKVTRDNTGLWKLFIDYSGGNEFVDAASGTDLTYPSGVWMGMVCVYTAGNATRFYYDDIYAGPPKVPPPPPEIAEPFDLVINEFLPDPSPPAGLADAEFVEIYNRSNKTFDLVGWKLGDATSVQSLPETSIEPGGYLVVSNSVSLNNSGDAIKLIDDHGVVIDSINYTLAWYQDDSKSGGGHSIERLNPEMSSNDPTNWYVSQSDRGGTPGERNSVFGRNPDSKPPVIRTIGLLNDSTIGIKVSEPVVVNKNNYQLAGTGSIGSVFFQAADTVIVIALTNLVNGTPYMLSITGFVDLAGNPGVGKDFAFTFFIAHPVHPKDILITELMADPAPVVQMPEAEYIELLNRSVYPVSLAGWRIEDATTKGSIPAVILLPGQYLLLTSTANASKFTTGKVIGVTGFPSLGNNADKIMLRNDHSVVVDSVSYNTTWYHSSEKSDGGWSMELIDINNPCGEGDNWTASEDTNGGTPGLANSVFADKPDLTPPLLTSLFAISADTLAISFNEKLGVAGSFSIPGKASFKDQNKRELVYVLYEKLSKGTEYPITISDVADCNGNVMEAVTLPVVLPEEAGMNDIVINEVLFNPRPTGSDFVEIYNRTGKYIDLKGWMISDELITTVNDIIPPHSYRALTSSIQSIETDYPSATGKQLAQMQLPSLPDDEGTVILQNSNGEVIDRFSYRDDMHAAILADTEGVSLERISPDDSTASQTNWHSANASAGFATPGDVNSGTRPLPGLEAGQVMIIPEVISPSSSATFSQIAYQFDRTGLVANVSVVDIEGRVIKSIAANETIAAHGSFHWDGDRDEGGRARCGYYLVWFQTFDLEGNVTVYRRRVVIGF
ncbi:MAG TPA: lamin tail domain-containing protein [Cyclobacteriaceae bacterium]|nr:lamin tail domain-containing protein [Cyclobacteriaceae bacterium]